MEKIIDEQLKREMFFDQYGRYATIRNIINANRGNGVVFKVLDVGGELNIMKKFLPDDDVYYLDPNVDSDDKNFIKADGCDMPFEDGDFDWVVSADVFEHIPKEKRSDFVKENIRVAKSGVILAAPFHTPEVAQAEINANENYKVLSGGKDHKWLKEHIENGLPEEGELEDSLNSKKYNFQKISANQLFLWELLVGVTLNVLEGNFGLVKKEFEHLNYFYNSEVFPFDNQEPAYRKIYFIKKDAKLKDLETSQRSIDNKLFLKTIKKGLDLTNEIDVKNKNIIFQKDGEIATLGQVVQQKDQTIQRKDEAIQQKDQNIRQKISEIQQKDAQINLMKSSKFWKARKFYLRTKKIIVRSPFLAVKGIMVLGKHGPREFAKRSKNLYVTREKASVAPADYSLRRKFVENKIALSWGELRQKSREFDYQPLISVILPVYNVEIKWLKYAVDSVLGQLYENWELCIVDDKSTDERIRSFLEEYGKKDGRIKLKFLEKNLHISGASNEALQMAEGEFVAFLDNDDEITSDALYEVVKVLNQDRDVDVIYSDEDKIDEEGNFSEPARKPDWDLDRLLTFNYTAHLSVYRKKIIDKIGGFRIGYEGAQDYDLMLRAIGQTKNIFHLKKILYHWRKLPSSVAVNPSSKPYAYEAGKKSLEDYLRRNKQKGKVTMPILGRYKIERN